jgi:hypothetical protein
MMRSLFAVTLAILLALTFAAPKADASDKNLIIATATTGGTYYPVGVAIGTLISIKLAKEHGITATAINSAGSGENVQMLKNKEADMGILQALFGAMAYHGKGLYDGRPVKSFRSMTMLWENVEHFALRGKHVDSGTIMDLKNLNEKFSIGKRGSGTEGSGRTILGALGIEPGEDFTSEFIGYNPSAQAMMDGRIAGANLPAGPPVAAVTQLFAQLGPKRVAVLDFTDEQLETIRGEFPIWSRYVVKAGTYPGQKEDINTIAQPNFLACRPDLPEDVVYRVLKTIYGNLPFLHNIHKATYAMKLERALAGLPVPLHPGAVKFYKEQGIEIPKGLIE